MTYIRRVGASCCRVRLYSVKAEYCGVCIVVPESEFQLPYLTVGKLDHFTACGYDGTNKHESQAHVKGQVSTGQKVEALTKGTTHIHVSCSVSPRFTCVGLLGFIRACPCLFALPELQCKDQSDSQLHDTHLPLVSPRRQRTQPVCESFIVCM